MRHVLQTAEWCQQLAAVAVTGIRQVQIVTNVSDLFTHVALVLFITDVISDNECRKERENLCFDRGKWGQ